MDMEAVLHQCRVIIKNVKLLKRIMHTLIVLYAYRPVRNANNHFDENTIDSCDFGYYTYGL